MSPRLGVTLAGAALVVVSAASSAACSSYRISEPRAEVLHPFAPIPADFARICVIRTSRLAQAVAFATMDNDALVGATKGPTFFCYKAEPGAHVLRIEADKSTTVQLRAEGGKSYYLHEKVPFAFIIRCDAVWVSESRARDLVDDSTYEVLTQTPKSQQLPGAVPFARAASR